MKNLNTSVSTQNETITANSKKKENHPHHPKIKSKLKEFFIKNILRNAEKKKYTYGSINLRTRTVKRITVEY
ncbi:MAG TPA: hypothetical protein QF753_17100 [Victivallales bacterium]|nr:hypothetical protein [Victivallales bacterium]